MDVSRGVPSQVSVALLRLLMVPGAQSTYIYTHYICYKELGHVIIEAEKPKVLQGRAGNPKES